MYVKVKVKGTVEVKEGIATDKDKINGKIKVQLKAKARKGPAATVRCKYNW